MDTSGQRGNGKYLKVKVLDFLDRRLAGGMKTWRQLAGEMPGYSSIDVDKFEADGSKLYQSSTKLLLCDWENRHGGCDVDQLKRYLEEMGRKDIILDLWEKFEKQGIELVESRSPQINTEQIGAYNNLQPITQEGQEVVLVGKMYKRTLHTCNLQFIPHQQESKLPPECHEHLMPHPSPSDSCTCTCNVRMEQKPVDSPIIERESHMIYSKRNSDPLQRKEVSPSHRDQNHWGSGSMETFFTPEKDSPMNLRKTNSEVIDLKPTQESNIRKQTLPEGRKDEASYQTPGDYHSLQSRSPDSVHVCDMLGHGGASPVTGKKYLLTSSNDKQDKQWVTKLCNILKKKGHHVYMVHEVLHEILVRIFYQVDFVVVIYTENYKKDFQTPGTANQELFQQMQLEYRSRNRVNHRFIPVYDVAAIRLLPDPLLRANPSERAYILDLLSNNKRPHNGSHMHSSAPSQGAVGRVGGAGRATSSGAQPIRGNNHTLSKSEPVIEREYHSPQNHAKPVHTEKKEKQSRFWSKNKKGK